MDPFFRVSTIESTPRPNQVVWHAMHQDYAEEFVSDTKAPSERESAKICVKKLLLGEKGHYGPYEHVGIILNVGWFPHCVIQQLRTHRVGVSFDVQSNRYTGERMIRAAEGSVDIEKIFYVRPVGFYRGRKGEKYEVTQSHRAERLEACMESAKLYKKLVEERGYSYEDARSSIQFDIRQHFVVSFNARSLMHVLDLRMKKDAQQEIQWMCDLILPKFCDWMPELAEWYVDSRGWKARLSP